MKQVNEEHRLLCKYSPKLAMPETITVSAYTTEMEQLRLSSENFHQVMIKHILPAIIYPKIPVEELYELDYYLILRRARLATWGPMFTAASYYCPHCKGESGLPGKLYHKKMQVRLDNVGVQLPDDGADIPTEARISRDELIFTEADVVFSMNKCKDLLLIEKTKVPDAKASLLGMAASLRSVTGEEFVDIREAVDWLANIPAADFKLLQEAYQKSFAYGLSTRGEVKCPVCGNSAWFFAPVNDYYFRPTREDLQEWKRLLADSQKTV